MLRGDRKRCRRRAFTLVEVLVVIAIIVVLAGLVLGVMSGVQRRAEISRAQGELSVLAQALEHYRSVHGDYPWVLQHAVEGEAAEANSRYLFQSLLGYRSPIGDKVLRGSVLQTRDDPLANLTPEQRRRFVNPSELTVGNKGQILEGEIDPNMAAAGGSFFEQSFYDPWGQPYIYLYRAERSPATWQSPGFVLYSLGPDGKAGTIGGSLPVGPDGRRPSGDPDAEAADNIYHATP